MLAKKAGWKHMANQEHLDVLKQGVKIWNQWRDKHRDIRLDLSKANLTGADLFWADLSGANLDGANLQSANLSLANLQSANLTSANLTEANLQSANLTGADLSRTVLVGTNFTDATLMNCHIYGISAWSVELKGATQNNLVITDRDEPTITV